MNQRSGWVVGIDAGGTRTRAVLADARDGRPLGEGAAGPGNALTVPGPRLASRVRPVRVPWSARPLPLSVLDAGGTMTDAVIVSEDGRFLVGKYLTNKQD
ncbi:hypothetical protein ABZ372_52280, partial [Streptomyces sp. NPDC005921]